VYSQVKSFEALPKEDLFLDTNTNLYVTGEGIYYSLHCFEKHTNSLSEISKIAYVLLINDSKKIVFNQKVLLQKGLGYGDFYIPQNFATGNYKLIAFTKWMKNNTTNPFFERDIYIINPFINRNKYSPEKYIDSAVLIKPDFHTDYSIYRNDQLKLDATKYKTRSKITLNFKNLSKQSVLGKYTLSVRRIDSIQIIKKPFQKKNISNASIKNIPEVRGEIIFGEIQFKNTNLPAPKVVVALSIEENPLIYKTVQTNNQGKFYFNLHETYKTNNLIIQVLNDDYNHYNIVVDDFSFEYANQLEFHDLLLNKNIANWLIEHSKNNQIENAFFLSKKDSIKDRIKPNMFYGKPSLSYVFDDYTRFSTVKETLVEIVHKVAERKRNGKREIVIYTPETQLDHQTDQLNSLVLIDGIPIQDHDILLDYNPNLIEKIEIVLEKYFLGPNIYDGILSVFTKKGNFILPNSFPHYKNKIVNPLPLKEYYTPNYKENFEELKKIPDYRTQLLWKPNINISNNSDKIEFYSSDVKGLYEIVLTSYSKQKEKIKIVNYFVVE